MKMIELHDEIIGNVWLATAFLSEGWRFWAASVVSSLWLYLRPAARKYAASQEVNR